MRRRPPSIGPSGREIATLLTTVVLLVTVLILRSRCSAATEQLFRAIAPAGAAR